MNVVEDFIYQHEDQQLEMLLFLHDLLTDQLQLTPKIRYQIPFYYRNSWICYLNPTKDGGIEFAFTRGNELSNAQGLLSSKGRKQVYSVEFRALQDIPREVVGEILQEAMLLDEMRPYASKRRSGKSPP